MLAIDRATPVDDTEGLPDFFFNYQKVVRGGYRGHGAGGGVIGGGGRRIGRGEGEDRGGR